MGRGSDEVKKSMAYDLIDLLEKNSSKKEYTSAEIIKMIKDYIRTLE